MNYPTVILIGGAPLIGKTAAARKLAVQLEYPCLATDDLADAVIAVTTAQSHPHLHLLEQKDHRKYFVKNTIARLVADAQYRNEGLWPAVNNVIAKHLESAAPVIIEGWHLLPAKIAQNPRPALASIWLIAEPALFEHRVQQQARTLGQYAPAAELIRKFIDRSTTINDQIQKTADFYDLPTVDVSPSATPDDLCRLCLEIINPG